MGARADFDRLREQNRGGPRFSFFDGPVTANKPLGIHTAWGRTLKDVFQRYKAMRGLDQRYQNGFDCQGLWIEVGVERELGLNSKREIEEYGLEEFARQCRESSSGRRGDLRGCKRLGQWMDWGNDYFTFSDTNIEYIWRFLAIVHGGLALPRPSLDRVVPALRHLDLRARVDRELRRPRRPVALRAVAAARPARRVPRRLDDDALDAARQRRRRGQSRGRVRAPPLNGEWVADAALPGRGASTRGSPARELVGWRYGGPVRRYCRRAPGSNTV